MQDARHKTFLVCDLRFAICGMENLKSKIDNLKSKIYSLPFDGTRRFGAYVINNPVNASHLVYNTVEDPAQEIIGQLRPIGGHGIFGTGVIYNTRTRGPKGRMLDT